jgi:H+/Cl- antiporter ClcA
MVMWYLDPFIVLPIACGLTGGFFFALTTHAARRKRKIVAYPLALAAAACASVAAFILTFGLLLNYGEVVEQWISIISV